MNFSDEELSELHALVYHEVMYGDDEIVYGDGPQAVITRRLLDIVTEEAKTRGLWWAR